MAFSSMERERRKRAMERIMESADLRALLLLGDTNVGNNIYGDFRYFVDNRIIFYRQVAVLFPGSEPVLLAGSAIQRQAASQRSSIRDCRQSDNLAEDLLRLLKERNISSGKVGVNLEVLPASWYNFLRQELPGIELVETHEQIFEVRGVPTGEEAELFRACGPLGDGGYEAALRMIRPGVSEYEITAAIEEYARARGAEQHFTLIGSGRFALGDKNGLPLPYSPSHRRIEAGDSVVLEITPCLEGYWTQLVRTVNVGEPNTELEKLYRVTLGALKKGLEFFKPGNTIREVVSAVDEYVKNAGYLPKPPYGHVCGVDLVEARVAARNEQVLQPGTAVILHPTVQTPDGKNSFFWGETYLITENGYEPVNHAKSDLLTL
jgi:Xaa-Pro aminopeptidase